MGEFAALRGAEIWFEVTGDGAPLVLLHGGLSDGSAWGLQVPAVAERHRVFVPDRRGHGRSPDTDAPFHYDDMAAETIAFLETIVRGPAHLVGWSDGGIVSLLVAKSRPDLVTRQVLIGANFHIDGLLPDFDTGDDPDAEHLAVIKMLYEGAAADPAHWPAFYAKAVHLFRTEPTLSLDDLRAIDVPTLVLAGDDDCVKHDHTVQLFETLPQAQLAIVPGTSHMVQMEKPALVNQLVLDFLAETAPPGTMYPMRRLDTNHSP
jgi:pimeloyl-ACP methyl ester carboxylesterase